MKKALLIIAALLTMISTVSCETVGKGPTAETVTGYEAES